MDSASGPPDHVTSQTWHARMVDQALNNTNWACIQALVLCSLFCFSKIILWDLGRDICTIPNTESSPSDNTLLAIGTCDIEGGNT
jgi:hypothetical protein